MSRIRFDDYDESDYEKNRKRNKPIRQVKPSYFDDEKIDLNEIDKE